MTYLDFKNEVTTELLELMRLGAVKPRLVAEVNAGLYSDFLRECIENGAGISDCVDCLIACQNI